jgi:putative oxidoreductase
MKWVIRIIQGILAAGFLMSGLMKLFSSSEQIREMFTETLGYRVGFMYTVGAVETLAALALVVGYWRINATLGSSVLLIVIMLGAIVSSLKEGLVADTALPLVYLVLLLVLLIAKRGGLNAERAAVGQTK